MRNGILVAILVVLMLVGIGAGYVSTRDTVTFEVTGTERIVSDGDSYYLVFTDQGPFANKDSLLFTKFSSSNVQNEMREGATCTAEVVGWRIPVFSTYQNIISVDCGGR